MSDILEMLASGMSIENVLEEYSQLTREIILEALAAELLKRKHRVIPLPA